MIVDLDATAPEELPTYDLCIVGSGPAGTTVANELKDAPFRVCVLESGRLRTTRRGDRLRAVSSEGLFIKEYSRERVLGGTSTTWAGLSSPLDPADLAPRDWLRHSGWPIGLDELLPHYGEAAERYRFPPLSFFGREGFGELRGKGDLQPPWEALDEKVFLACAEPQNFGREFRELYESPAVDLLIDATVQRLEAEDGRIVAARVRTGGGKELALRARAFVLATGGIENARLLLVSRDLHTTGLGNQHDQVGRYFMNHPKNYSGILRLRKPVAEAPYFFGCLFQGYAGYAGLRLPEEVQRERGLLNSYVRMEPLFPWSDNEGIESLVLFVKRTSFVLKRFRKKHEDEVVSLRDYSETGDDSDLQNERKSALSWLGLLGKIAWNAPRVAQYLWYRLVPGAVPKIREVRVRNFMEMEPDPDNRVVLSAEKDEDGKQLPHVESRCTALDQRSLTDLHAALAAEVERAGLGELVTDLAEADPWPITLDASHHIGTTRMGVDPATSVVTPDLSVHGADNVYLAGGSVFPTSGCANPTFTIVALSIRLARHLRERFEQPAAEGGLA
ncbi:MAG: GMC family oxidoreductase [Planctomycetota bacterium]